MSNIKMRNPKTDPPPKDGTLFIADLCMQRTYVCRWSHFSSTFIFSCQSKITGFKVLPVDEILWWCEMPVVDSGYSNVMFPCELTGEDQFRYELMKEVGEA